ERPYGWGWLLALQAELGLHTGDLAAAAQTHRPLADAFAQRFHAFLPISDYPVRTGDHTSTAFASRLCADLAEASYPRLYDPTRATGRAWYGADRDCQAWQPSQDGYHSPAPLGAACMRRMLSASASQERLGRFLPRLAQGHTATL